MLEGTFITHTSYLFITGANPFHPFFTAIASTNMIYTQVVALPHKGGNALELAEK